VSFSQNWSKAYSEKKQISSWPWNDLISLYYMIRKKINKEKIKVLELGFGTGANYSFFSSLDDVEYYGIEGSKEAVDFTLKAHPNLKNNIMVGDFTKEFCFNEIFDIVFDRAAITHNSTKSIKKCVDFITNNYLGSGSFFLGVHWFSDQNSYFKQGKVLDDDFYTRTGYESGPYKDIEPIHFFNEYTINEFFEKLKLFHIEHNTKEIIHSNCLERYNLAYWNFVFQLEVR